MTAGDKITGYGATLSSAALGLEGIPVIRNGDNVFLLTQPKHDYSRMLRDAKRMAVLLSHYRCPFSFLYEFDKWWEWQERTIVKKQATGLAMFEMTDDEFDWKEYEIERTLAFKVGTYDFSSTIDPRTYVAYHA